MDDQLEKLEENSETSAEVASSWNSSHETLLAAIADRANCYRWLHTKCELLYEKLNFYLTVPSITVSAIAGSATIGMSSMFASESQQSASTIIGLLTLACGVLTSVNQFMKTAQFAEAHRTAAIAYGKLHRVISCELTLRRDQRVNATDFLKVVRAEQDRLHESTPNIVERVIQQFRKEFKDNTSLEKPEIVGDLDHVVVNQSSKHESYTPKTFGTFRLSTPPVPGHHSMKSIKVAPEKADTREEVRVSFQDPAILQDHGLRSHPQSEGPHSKTH